MKRKAVLATTALTALLALSACGQAQPAASDANSSDESSPIAITDVQADNDAAISDAEAASATEPQAAAPVYDTSEQHGAAALASGDALLGGTYTATGTDESAIEASSGAASVEGSAIVKASGGASSADDSSFKGVNAAVRAYGSADLTLTNVQVSASADNATGVFAYDGATITIANSTIEVTGGGSGGVQVAGGGTLYGSNLTVSTTSKAPIRSDRGGGTMVIDGGTYTTTGSGGCPVIYSTADITVNNATGSSENSRAVIIEGKNSVTLENTDLTGNDQSTKQGSVRAAVLLYQSASGDASEGTSVFSMTGGSLTSKNGALFYCTNTNSVVNLDGATLVPSGDNSLLIVSAGRWGHDGSNGGSCIFNATHQQLAGSITVDSISSLSLNLENSTFEGSINSSGQAGSVSVSLDANSTWTLTADSYVSSFDGDLSTVTTNGYHLYVNGSMVL